MDRSQIGELFYITHVANVASIVTTGILSHNMAAKIGHRSVALNVIQERRERVRVSPTDMLHDHANLYICARNPMMYYVVHNNPIDEVCLLRVSPDVLDLPDVAVSSFNASRNYVRFDPPAVGLPPLVFGDVHMRSWRRPDDEVEDYRLTGIKCAEVLVPDLIDPQYVIGAYAPTPAVAAALTGVIGRRDVRLAPDPFFPGYGWTP